MYSTRKLKSSARKLKKLRRKILFHVVAFALLAFAIYFTIIRKDEEERKAAQNSSVSLQID
jgi:preprotein translocase subunit YajC